MTELEPKHYFAGDKKIFVRNSDSYRMGRDLYLSDIDSIDNYSEEDQTSEEIAAYEKIDNPENDENRG